MTWYKSDDDLPDMNDYDIIKGKRTYQYFDREVLYPFGHGLSYTSFSYGKLTLEEKADKIIARLSVTNTGSRTADEVVQLYVHKEKSRVKQPVMQLKSFVRLKDLAPGETAEAELIVNREELRYYDVISEAMLLESGDYTFMAGASSGDIRQQAVLRLEGETAGKRSPWEVTAADRYDDYENCFIHKGVEGYTCVIPGKAGDKPDEVKAELPQNNGALPAKIKSVLVYRDFCFERAPEETTFTLYALEDGKIKLTVTPEASEGISMEIPVKAGAGFEEWLKSYRDYPVDSSEYTWFGYRFYCELIHHSGFFLHASAVSLDNRAYLFSADSGTGKSTHTGLWLEYFGKGRAFLINDDKPALRKGDSGYLACGTPFSGKHD